MLIKIDFNSDKPIYEQIYDDIIKAIATNEISSGDMLPSVRRLGADLSVNLHTVAKAYTKLKNAGYLSTNRSKGMTINPPQQYRANAEYKSALKAKLTPLIHEANIRGLSYKDITKIIEEISPNKGVNIDE